MSKILIIGTNSFVGTNFERYSKFNDIETVSLIENKPEEISFNKYDVVLHLAAIVHQEKSIPESEYYRVNRDLCIKVAKRAKRSGVKQFVFMSTVKVYGDNNLSVKNEKSACFPTDAYGKSKYEAELGLKDLEDANFKIAIVRTPLVYGEGVKANMLKIIKLVKKFSVLPLGNINNRRSMTYIENLAAYLDCIIEQSVSGIFIAQDERPISTTKLVEYIAKGFGKHVTLVKIPGLFMKVGFKILPKIFSRLFGSLEFDNNFTKEYLGHIPGYSTKQGIQKMIETYVKNTYH